MCTGFDHAALMKDYYPVRVTDGREAMCYDNGGSICLKQIKSFVDGVFAESVKMRSCLLYTSPSPRDVEESRMPSSA